jgi:hypothetical protein
MHLTSTRSRNGEKRRGERRIAGRSSPDTNFRGGFGRSLAIRPFITSTPLPYASAGQSLPLSAHCKRYEEPDKADKRRRKPKSAPIAALLFGPFSAGLMGNSE